MTGSTKKLCVVTIGLEVFVMPAADGMRVAALMQGAKPAVRNYDGGNEFSYVTGVDEAEVTWASVRNGQVTAQPGAKARRGRRVAAEAEAS